MVKILPSSRLNKAEGFLLLGQQHYVLEMENKGL